MTSRDPWNVPLGIEDRSGTEGMARGRAAVGDGGRVGTGGRVGEPAGGLATGLAAARGDAAGGKARAALGGGGEAPPAGGAIAGVWAHDPSGPAVTAVA
jgi:hypothetical protein